MKIYRVGDKVYACFNLMKFAENSGELWYPLNPVACMKMRRAIANGQATLIGNNYVHKVKRPA